MTGLGEEEVPDFEDPPRLFLFEDRLKSVLGGPLFFNRILAKQGGFRGDERVLDFGCGGGVSTRCIAKRLTRGGEVVGVDTSSVMIGRAQPRLRKYPNADAVRGELRSLDIDDASFDVAVAIFVIHDIPRGKREETVAAIADKLKPGGALWVVEPTKASHGIPVDELRTLMESAGLYEISAEAGKSSYRGKFVKR